MEKIINKTSTTKNKLEANFKMSKLLFMIVTVYIATLVLSNTIGGKIISIGGIELAASVLVFPIIYVIADLLTEVYGYKFARYVIWIGFAINLYVVIIYWAASAIPGTEQMAYSTVLGSTSRILFASFISYLCGSFANAKSMSILKVKLKGEKLWVRTIGSTLIGEALDTSLFIFIAFIGTMSFSALLSIILFQYIIKVTYEALCTPLIYYATKKVKQVEQIDVFDN